MDFEGLRCLALLYHISNSRLYLPHPKGIIKKNKGFAESVNGFFESSLNAYVIKNVLSTMSP